MFDVWPPKAVRQDGVYCVYIQLSVLNSVPFSPPTCTQRLESGEDFHRATKSRTRARQTSRSLLMNCYLNSLLFDRGEVPDPEIEAEDGFVAASFQLFCQGQRAGRRIRRIDADEHHVTLGHRLPSVTTALRVLCVLFQWGALCCTQW